jgi:hypothetical protein
MDFDLLKTNIMRVLTETNNTSITFINTFNVLSLTSFKQWLQWILDLREEFAKEKQGTKYVPVPDNNGHKHPDFVINPKQIIVADSSAEKRNLAISLGVESVFDSTSENFLDMIVNLSNGGVDVAYECAGSTESIETAFKCLKAPGGQLIFASHPNSGEKIKLDPFDLIRGKKIRGSWGGNSLPDRDIPKFTKLLGKQLSKLDTLFGKTYCLEEINLALESLDNGEIFRPIIDMQI